MKQVEKLDYLDGVKVLAAIMIYNFHFINFFYPGEYSLLPEQFHTQSLEYIFGSTPLNIIAGGKFAVRMFMTLSGFFVGYRFFITGDKKSLQTGVIKKYFRLFLPILVTNLLIVFLMWIGAYGNAEASVLAGSEVFVGNYNTFSPNLFAAIKEALWGCFVTGENNYNGPLWFIYYEFFGTLLMAAILMLVGESKARYIVYAVASVICIRNDFLPFILGTVVCDLTYQPPLFIERLSKKKIVMIPALIFGLFLGSFPPIGERMEGTIYQYFPLKIIVFYILGAAITLYAILHLKGVQKVLSWKGFVWFNKSSYNFYLLHFMVLCTFSCQFYLALKDKMNYHVLAMINIILSFIVTAGLSYVMHRWVEVPGIRLSQKVGAFFERK
ncbi:MAG: acyltransferase [Lachnospiraceae bacterium]|nr:acyltransferase [Lachnospiraceae bacterium]